MLIVKILAIVLNVIAVYFSYYWFLVNGFFTSVSTKMKYDVLLPILLVSCLNLIFSFIGLSVGLFTAISYILTGLSVGYLIFSLIKGW